MSTNSVGDSDPDLGLEGNEELRTGDASQPEPEDDETLDDGVPTADWLPETPRPTEPGPLP